MCRRRAVDRGSEPLFTQTVCDHPHGQMKTSYLAAKIVRSAGMDDPSTWCGGSSIAYQPDGPPTHEVIPGLVPVSNPRLSAPSIAHRVTLQAVSKTVV